MIDFKELTIEDKTIVEPYLKNVHPQNSETSFTTLFLWMHQMHYAYAIVEGCLCIQAAPPCYPAFCFFPYGGGNEKEAVRWLKADFSERGIPFRMKLFGRETVDIMESLFPGEYDYEELRFSHDYVYRSEDLIHLKGKKLHQKRNHVNQFLEANPDYIYEKITPLTAVSECKPKMDAWLAQRDTDTTEERIAMHRLFDHYEALGVDGCMIKLGETIIAISVGEALNEEMALIQVEKSEREVRGSSNIINQQFCARRWAAYPLINREEDMGIEGLRRAKLSYQPAFLLEKFMAKPAHVE